MSERLFPIEWDDRTALVIEPSGASLAFGDLEAQSNRVAHLLEEHGIRAGDTVAILMENRLEFLVIAWAAQRLGLYCVAVNHHLTTLEARYIIENSNSTAIFATEDYIALGGDAAGPAHRFAVDCVPPAGWEPFDVEKFPTTPVSTQSDGDFLLYSSGTTGKPKGIKRPLTQGPLGSRVDPLTIWLTKLLGFVDGNVYLSPAPLYHAAPLGWSMAAQKLGGTVVVMGRFDPEIALSLIQKHRVTHSQWVPTMFVRMLKLPEDRRARYDLSNQQVAVHPRLHVRWM